MAATLPITLKKTPSFMLETFGSTVCITGSKFSLSDIDVQGWATSDVIIRGYDVTLRSSIVAPGRKITIVARNLKVVGPTRISVDGNAGDDHSVEAHNDGKALGEKGEDGLVGKIGSDGGSVELIAFNVVGANFTISANGGAGGLGQNGGNGQKGKTGANGKNGDGPKPYTHPGQPGGDGGQGGTAGKGGNGGTGGQGGDVSVWVGPDAKVILGADGGDGGLPGSPGLPGGGGDGGGGGQEQKWYSGICEKGPCTWTPKLGKHAKSGNTGPSGLHAEAGLKGAGGPQGKVSSMPFSYGETLKRMTLTALQFILHEGELLYLNSRNSEAAEVFYWVVSLARAQPPDQPIVFAGGLGQSILDEDAETAKLGLNSLCKRAETLLIQLSQGLDFFGMKTNFVPLLSFSTYQDTVEMVLRHLKDLESASQILSHEKLDAEKGRNAILDAVVALENKAIEGKALISNFNTNIELGKAEVRRLLSEVEELRLQLEKAEKKFVEAIRDKAGCGISDVLKAASSVAAIGTGIGSIAGGIQGLSEFKKFVDDEKLFDSKKLIDDLKGLKKAGDYFVKEFKVIGGGLDDVKQGYKDIAAALSKGGDEVKLITAKDEASWAEFEATIRDFEGLAAAEDYRALMRRYLDTVQLRNQTIVHLDTLRTRIAEIETTVNASKLAAQKTKADLNQYTNPDLIQHVVLIETSVASLRAEIIRCLVMEDRALRYWSLGDSALSGLNLSDKSHADLSKLQATLALRHVQELERRNQEATPFSYRRVAIWGRQKAKEEFRVLDTTGRLTFILDAEHDPMVKTEFQFQCIVLLQSVKIEIEYDNKVKTYSGNRNVSIRHQGNSTIRDQLGERHFFLHSPRLKNTRLETKMKELTFDFLEGSSSEKKYVDISPFASWSISFESEPGKAAPIKDIRSISLSISGKSYAFGGV